MSRALVTGASSGIGYAICAELASRGFDLVMVSRTGAKLEAAAARLKESFPGADIVHVPFDLSRPEAAGQLHDWTVSHGYPVDILVNDAGLYLYSELLDTDPKVLESIINLNVLALTQLCRLYGQDMAAAGAGRILNMSSYSIYMPYRGLAAYSATKIYVRQFSRCLRKELKPCGISVMAAAPAGVDTGLMGLSDRIRSIARRASFLMKPSTAARRLVRAMLKGRAFIIPGWYNAIWIPFLRPIGPLVNRVLDKETLR